MNSSQKGSIAELAVASDIAQRGFTVLLPIGVTPYWDLVFTRDYGSSFERVQVKSAMLTKGVLVANSFRLQITSLCSSVEEHSPATAGAQVQLLPGALPV
jgi:hypothetical protein